MMLGRPVVVNSNSGFFFSRFIPAKQTNHALRSKPLRAGVNTMSVSEDLFDQ